MHIYICICICICIYIYICIYICIYITNSLSLTHSLSNSHSLTHSLSLSLSHTLSLHTHTLPNHCEEHTSLYARLIRVHCPPYTCALPACHVRVARVPNQSLRGDAGTSTGVFCLWRFHQRGGSAGCQQETPGQMPAGTEPAKCQRSHHALSHHWSLSAIVLINLETN